MNKSLTLVIAGIMLVMTALASPIGKTKGEHLDIPILPGDGQEDTGRPRNLSPFVASLDVDFNTLSIYTLIYIGEVEVTIDNLTTGEHAEDSFDSAMTAFFPISGNAGIWHITLVLGNGVEYCGVFEL